MIEKLQEIRMEVTQVKNSLEEYAEQWQKDAAQYGATRRDWDMVKSGAKSVGRGIAGAAKAGYGAAKAGYKIGKPIAKKAYAMAKPMAKSALSKAGNVASKIISPGVSKVAASQRMNRPSARPSASESAQKRVKELKGTFAGARQAYSKYWKK